MRIYAAAPLFTEAERAFNLVLARALEVEGHEVYLPQRDTPSPHGIGRITSIFHANLVAHKAAGTLSRLPRLSALLIVTPLWETSALHYTGSVASSPERGAATGREIAAILTPRGPR
jgi:hypothetical protein